MENLTTLPVFIQPTELLFIVSNPDTHKKILTIFNPYDFSLRFTVLSNAPLKYRVVEPKGFIRSKCFLDIIVRHLSPNLASVGNNDCLRLEIFRENESKPCGRKDVALNLVASDTLTKPINENQFCSFPNSTSNCVVGALKTTFNNKQNKNVSFSSNSSSPQFSNQGRIVRSQVFNIFTIFCFFISIIILFLPTAPSLTKNENDFSISSNSLSSSFSNIIPLCLRPSSTIQLVASYALGLLTSFFFLQSY